MCDVCVSEMSVRCVVCVSECMMSVRSVSVMREDRPEEGEGREEEEEDGADTELKTKNPHVNVGNHFFFQTISVRRPLPV